MKIWFAGDEDTRAAAPNGPHILAPHENRPVERSHKLGAIVGVDLGRRSISVFEQAPVGHFSKGDAPNVHGLFGVSSVYQLRVFNRAYEADWGSMRC
jgi:hypothetical protein